MIAFMAPPEKSPLFKFRKYSLGLNQEALAQRLGLPRPTYAAYEVGRLTIPPDVAKKLQQLGFAVPMERRAVLTVADPRIPTSYPPVPMPSAGELPAGDWSEPMESEDFEDVDGSLFKTNRFCARIVGDSCHPALQRGDFCIWEVSQAPMFGKLVVAEREKDHWATVKLLEWDEAKRGPVLRPLNPDHEPAEATEGWKAIAMLVYVKWLDLDGGFASFYREDGIKPSQLTRYRS